MRRLLLATLVALIPLPALAAGETRFELRRGQIVLIEGPKVENSSGDRTFTYFLDVAPGGKRLRVGLDHPQVGDLFHMEIFGPDGDRWTSMSVGPGIYSDEVLLSSPPAGTWKLRVTARDVTDSAFRVRAKLEARLPSLGTKKGPILPNLQILPPHDASFMFPITNGAADADPTGVDIGGRAGCHPEEHAEDRAVRCMRFGFGVRNTGLGPMDLHYPGSHPTERDLIQRIHRADGTTFDRPAGKASFHKTHGHFHHAAAVGLQLLRVVDRKTGELEAAGDERTKGFAHRNELLREWDVFYPTLEPLGIGLRPGWADIYEWDRPGNYIDFGLNPDGFYVLRMSADPVGGILESNEKDNYGYTYMEVAGNEVKLIEAGRGRDPWDRCKIVVGFGGFPDPARSPRPANCPPDTT